MIVCPNCRSNQLDGAIFCLDCGASLMTETTQESTRQIGAGNAPVTAGLSERTGTDPIGSPAIALVVAHSGRRLRFDIDEELLIGRADTNKGIHPDIDLGPEGGFDAGVSRRHAIVTRRESSFLIEDLGSANGTFVNGRRLAPQAAVPLRSGDELKCGTLVLRVEIGGS